MRNTASSVFGLALVALASGFALANEGEEPAAVETTALKYQSLKKWSVILPTEQWTTILDDIPIAHSRGDGFLVEQTGPMKLEIDTNGDGKVDNDVKGQGGFLKLRGKRDDGSSFDYAVRIKLEENAWKYAPGGAVAGKLQGTMISVIDQDNNGRYDDYGSDAMVIGSGDTASLLSRVVSIGGELFDFEINGEGTQASIKPFAGETGILDLASDFESNGKLLSAVVHDRRNDLSFDLSSSPQGMAIPAGEYRFVKGFAKKGGESVWIRNGRMAPLKVKAGETLALAWGGPVQADFSWSAGAGTVTVNKDVHYYGRSMEEYTDFYPNAKSPKIIVRDAKGKVVLEGRFPGC
jgi:hypothetical protein